MSKVCLIIGGTGGLGGGCAVDLSSDYKIVVAGRSKDKGDKIVETIRAKGGQAFFMAVDMTDLSTIKKLHKDVWNTFGRLDAAINAAGILGDLANVADMSEDNITKIIQINLTSVIFCIQEQIRLMQANPGGSGGRIVNFGSVYSLKGCQMGSVYSATKYGLVGVTKSAAREYSGPKDNILINCIAPGVIITPMTEVLADPSVVPDGPVKDIMMDMPNNYAQKRFGEVADCNRGVRFLLESPWVTGTCLEVEGGFGA